MNWRLWMAFGATLLAAGCGDDGGAPGEGTELSGVFQAGNVIGVSYHTPTRNGVTDASGTFRYLAGETVTFSIGGIRLGQAPGAAGITPFTLAGMTPPTTEPALRRELDRATRTTGNFVRAINMDRLLLALDADHNPANGIDVRGREAALASATIDFDQTIFRFAAELEKLAPDLTHNIPQWVPVVHLYRSLGIVVPVHAPVQYDFEGGFLSTRQTVIAYNPDGSRQSQDTFDAFLGATYGTSYTYDPFGRTTSRRSVGQPFYQSDFTDEERWSYDARGTLTSNIRERDQDADGVIDLSMSAAHEFDAFNNVLRRVARQDSGNDGTVDQIDDYRATYDARLNRVRAIWEFDNDANGTIESRSELTAEYDSRNRLIYQRMESDGDGEVDGVVDFMESFSITYAAHGPAAVEIYEVDNDADGDVDLRLTYRWSYDSAGKVRSIDVLQEYDADENGQTDQHIVQVVTYDRDGRPTSEVTSEDWDGYPGYETVSRYSMTYTDFGSPLRTISEHDAGGDGTVDSRYSTDYVYGPSGELLSSADFSGQGPAWVPVAAGSTQVTNALMADGVLALAQQYFGFASSPSMDSTF